MVEYEHTTHGSRLSLSDNRHQVEYVKLLCHRAILWRDSPGMSPLWVDEVQSLTNLHRRLLSDEER